jgi:hypothetical protein
VVEKPQAFSSCSASHWVCAEERQRPGGGDLRVDLAQRSGGGVARVGVGLLAGLGGRGVQGRERLVAQVDLAADLDHLRPALAGQPLGDVGNRADVLGDILAHPPVASGRGLDQHATLVADRARQAVDLRLGGVAHGLVGRQPQEPPDAGVEVDGFLVGEGVVQAQHGNPMLHRRELLRTGRADPKRWRIVADQVRESVLDLQVPPLQRVVVAVRDRGGVLLVIAKVVRRQLVGERSQLLGGFGLRQVGDRFRHP